MANGINSNLVKNISLLCHTKYFDHKLDNFEFGVVRQVDPRQFDRVEDFYRYLVAR